MKRKIVGTFAHAKHTWIVETVRSGDVRSIQCKRCVITTLLSLGRQRATRRQQFVKDHSKCKEK